MIPQDFDPLQIQTRICDVISTFSKQSVCKPQHLFSPGAESEKTVMIYACQGPAALLNAPFNFIIYLYFMKL